MPELTSAYNFVPLNERVFFPEPDDFPPPFQDTPYSDGLSGTIELQIEATTPLYVRAEGHFDKETRQQAADALGQKWHHLNGTTPNATWQKALDAMSGHHADFLRAYADFYRLPDDSYAVPWSEVKGMLRTVVEIASWGKLHGVSKELMSFRDLRNRDLYGHWFVEREGDGFRSRSQAGWITAENGNWVLTPCSYARVQIEHLEAYFGRTFDRNIDLHTEQSAPSKYRSWGLDNSRKVNFDFELENGMPKECWCHDKEVWDSRRGEWRLQRLRLRYRLANRLIRNDRGPGEVVMCGQPASFDAAAYREDGLRRKSKKHLEFIFYEERPNHKKTISQELREDFESAHLLPPGENPAEWAWGFWRERLKAGERMPVFYLESGGQITDIGLAQLFRLNYKNTLWQRLPEDHKSPRPDLAELIFGPIGDSARFWRGRVWGQPFEADDAPQPSDLCVSVLGTPRPSFYPNYLVQPNQGHPYRTLDDADAELRGWKRYPVPKDNALPRVNPPIEDQGRPKMGAATYFRPLPVNTTFSSEIAFHNLRPWELGALLWAIGLGKKITEQPQSILRHSLGMAKPLGYGAVHLTVTRIGAKNVHGEKQEQEKVEHAALYEFNKRMAASCAGSGWETSPRINELTLMADERKQPSPLALLHHPGEVEHFAEFKKHREVLPPFSKLPGVQP